MPELQPISAETQRLGVSLMCSQPQDYTCLRCCADSGPAAGCELTLLACLHLRRLGIGVFRDSTPRRPTTWKTQTPSRVRSLCFPSGCLFGLQGLSQICHAVPCHGLLSCYGATCYLCMSSACAEKSAFEVERYSDRAKSSNEDAKPRLSDILTLDPYYFPREIWDQDDYK